MNTVNNVEENYLVLQLRNNDIGAFERLYCKYNVKIYAFAFSFFKNQEDSKEIVQEAFCRVWHKRHGINPSKSFKSFLYTITYNLIIDQIRLNKRDQEYRTYLLKYFVSHSDFTNNNIDYKTIEEKVRIALEEFPERRKLIFLLSREKGLSQKEIANKLGVSVKTVENHINLGLKHIRMHLGENFISLFYNSVH